MSSAGSRYDLLASILEYPTQGTLGALNDCLAQLRRSCPSAAQLLAGLGQYLRHHSLESAQEVYTHTFDLSPVCALEVGYHLFGEDYQRGAFLARLRQSQTEVGMEAGEELPDHLPVILRWLGRVFGSEVYADMVTECVLPALERMQRCFDGGANPYRHLPGVVAAVLQEDLASLSGRRQTTG